MLIKHMREVYWNINHGLQLLHSASVKLHSIEIAPSHSQLGLCSVSGPDLRSDQLQLQLDKYLWHEMAAMAFTALLCVYAIGTGLVSEVSGQSSDQNVLPQGGAIPTNGQIRLGNVYSLVMQEDCNLVLSHTEVGPLWESGTANRGQNCFFVLQPDGNGVIYKDNTFSDAVWSTQTCCRGDGDHFIVIQPDGNVCMYNYNSNQALWATNTRGRL